jgi:hypothetical protein
MDYDRVEDFIQLGIEATEQQLPLLQKVCNN